jgi:head-tail adaptor
LNRRLLLEAPVETDDGAGGVTLLYDVVTVLWAQVLPLSATASVTAGNAGATVRYRIIVRARSDIREGIGNLAPGNCAEEEEK